MVYAVIPYQIYQPTRAGNLPIPAKSPVNRWDTTLGILNFVTRTTIKMWHFLNGTLNRKDIDILWQEIPHIEAGYTSSQSSSRYTGIFHFGILYPFQIVYLVGYTSSQSSSQYIKVFHFGILRQFHLCEVHVVIHYHDLKNEVAKNVKLSMKTDTVDIFITGPFCNAKAGKSTWIVVFGDYGSA